MTSNFDDWVEEMGQDLDRYALDMALVGLRIELERTPTPWGEDVWKRAKKCVLDCWAPLPTPLPDPHGAWKALVVRYADGRPICNCREAYYTPCGRGIDKDGNHRTDMLVCKHGCSSNRLTTRDEIAEKILEELHP